MTPEDLAIEVARILRELYRRADEKVRAEQLGECFEEENEK